MYYYFNGAGTGHIQSLILASMLIIIGVQTMVIGFCGDIMTANRKLIEDVQYRVKNLEYELLKEGKKKDALQVNGIVEESEKDKE